MDGKQFHFQHAAAFNSKERSYLFSNKPRVDIYIYRLAQPSTKLTFAPAGRSVTTTLQQYIPIGAGTRTGT